VLAQYSTKFHPEHQNVSVNWLSDKKIIWNIESGSAQTYAGSFVKKAGKAKDGKLQ